MLTGAKLPPEKLHSFDMFEQEAKTEYNYDKWTRFVRAALSELDCCVREGGGAEILPELAVESLAVLNDTLALTGKSRFIRESFPTFIAGLSENEREVLSFGLSIVYRNCLNMYTQAGISIDDPEMEQDAHSCSILISLLSK